MKTCTGCHQDLPESSFYARGERNGALRGRCKECERQRNAVNNRNWRKSNPEGAGAAKTRWSETPQGSRATWAKRILRRDVRSGRLTPPSACERCGNTGPVEGHHADYSLPLQVEWLCRSCHLELHGKVLRA